ncbi:hypothetical protein V1477_014108 [Vespula maculifrons]|uniref:Uncharacterized protein n=1 Tax=Vespula maculifrons TaxID=7453 RepID=A0ABD2BKI4_VESMC
MQQPPRGGTWVGITCDISNLMRCKVLRVKKVGRVRKILLLAKGTAKTTDLFGALGKDHPFRIPTPWTLAGTLSCQVWQRDEKKKKKEKQKEIRLLDSRRDNCEPCTDTFQESERDGRASGVLGIGSHRIHCPSSRGNIENIWNVCLSVFRGNIISIEKLNEEE